MNQHIDTKRQYTYLKKIFDVELFKLLGQCKAFVAGGAISCLFTDRTINDFDLYFPGRDELEMVTAYLKKTTNWQSDFCSNLSITYKNQKPIAINDPCEYGKTIVIGSAKIQLVTAFYGDVKDIFNTFDFFCCMGAFQFSNNEFVFDPYFFNDNMSRTLRYNYEGAANPLTTMFRVEKYKKYGYSLPMEEMMKIVFAIKNIKLSTVQDMKNFLRMLPPGVYKKVLISELIEKPLEAMRITFNNVEGKKKYDDFMSSPCSSDSVVAILADINSFIANMKDDIKEDGPSNNIKF